MYEFFSQNAIYTVLVIVLIVWSGIFGYMWMLDKRLKDLEKKEGE